MSNKLLSVEEAKENIIRFWGESSLQSPTCLDALISAVRREERAKLICSECEFPKEIEREPVFLKNDVISLLKYEDNVCGTCGCQKDGSTIPIVVKKIRGVAERVRKIERERAVKIIEKYFTTAKGNRIYNPFVIHLSEKILEEK